LFILPAVSLLIPWPFSIWLHGSSSQDVGFHDIRLTSCLLQGGLFFSPAYLQFVYNGGYRCSGRVPMVREDLPREQNADGGSAPTNVLEFLKSLGAAAGVLTGLAFINGWLYWATYYTAFGLNSLVLNLPFSVVSVSLVQVIVRDWKSESGLVKVILILAVFAGAALTVLFAHWYKHRHAGATLLPVILVLGMALGSWWLGFHDAGVDGGCSSRLPTIAFELIGPADKPDLPLPCLQGSGETCLLVLHINNTYRYFVAPDQEFCGHASSSPGAGRMTHEISDAQVRIANIQTHIGW
jgi:hypothetical protein